MLILTIVAVIFGIIAAISFFKFTSSMNMGISVWGKSFMLFLVSALIVIGLVAYAALT